MTLNNLFLTTLGLARRAGKLVYGFESCVENAPAIKLLFLANDSSQRTQQSIKSIFEEYETEIISLDYSKNELAYAIGTKPVGVIGIIDSGFAKLLKTKLSEEVI